MRYELSSDYDNVLQHLTTQVYLLILYMGADHKHNRGASGHRGPSSQRACQAAAVIGATLHYVGDWEEGRGT